MLTDKNRYTVYKNLDESLATVSSADSPDIVHIQADCRFGALSPIEKSQIEVRREILRSRARDDQDQQYAAGQAAAFSLKNQAKAPHTGAIARYNHPPPQHGDSLSKHDDNMGPLRGPVLVRSAPVSIAELHETLFSQVVNSPEADTERLGLYHSLLVAFYDKYDPVRKATIDHDLKSKSWAGINDMLYDKYRDTAGRVGVGCGILYG